MSGFNLFDLNVHKHMQPIDHLPVQQPLSMTVHSLPQPGAQPDPALRTKVGRWKMLLVLLMCTAPVMASYVMYYLVRPEGRRNFGELVEQRPTPALMAASLDGTTVNLQSLKGQWLLVSVAGGACDAVCQNHLYLQRQLRESLGKEKDRLDWVWLVTDDAPVPETLRPALKGATVLRLPADKLATWLEPATGQQLSDHLYVVDPMGNWMMRFAAGFNTEAATRAKRDIERVLRASASWDQAGR